MDSIRFDPNATARDDARRARRAPARRLRRARRRRRRRRRVERSRAALPATPRRDARRAVVDAVARVVVDRRRRARDRDGARADRDARDDDAIEYREAAIATTRVERACDRATAALAVDLKDRSDVASAISRVGCAEMARMGFADDDGDVRGRAGEVRHGRRARGGDRCSRRGDARTR